MIHILSQSLEMLQKQLAALGEQSWRAGQILDWVYRKHVRSFEECTNLSKSLREKLAQQYSFYTAPLVTVSGREHETQKFLWRLEDDNLIESVLIPAGVHEEEEEVGRHTLCVSTQVGCACGCKFCASGRSGLVRNLATAEIVDQVLGAIREGHTVQNIVVMGMGEPLANVECLLAALEIINAPWGCNIGARKITISTSGLAPVIRRLAKEPHQYRLAISLHASTDMVRQEIMPINRRYPLEVLLDACEDYQREKGRMISFEYILIKGVNDTPEQCQGLIDIAERFHAHVNLIPYNMVEGCNFRRPEQGVIQAFYQELVNQGISVTLRTEKGGNMNAACGQLRLRKMSKTSDPTK